MMAAAAATKTIKIGSGICLVIEHDPIKLAKEVASLDMLSNGRLLLVSAADGTRRKWKIMARRSRNVGKYYGKRLRP